ncbi:TPA: hypothetical protein ACFRG8_000083 [Neisseria lactamica]
MPSEALPIIGMWFQTAFVLFFIYSAKIGTVVFYSGLTKTSTALPRLSSKRTIL